MAHTTASSSSSVLVHPPTEPARVIELYENERTWIGGGFSKRGLLPNADRGRYSTLDGSMSFATLAHAADALLLPGCAYDDDDGTFVPTQPTGDADDDTNNNESWYYARDFSQGAIAHATQKKALLHLVRFRKLQRRQHYDPRTLLLQDDPLTVEDIVAKCSYGDSTVLQQLSQTMVEVVTYLTQLYGPPRSSGTVTTTAAVLKAKRKVAAVLADITLPYRSLSITPVDRIAALQHCLVTLAQTERNQPQHVLSSVEVWDNRHKPKQSAQTVGKASTTDTDDDALQYWNTQCHELRRTHFPEVDVWTGWILRVLDDPEFTLHCATPQCAASPTPAPCPFALVPCPNQGCPVQLSQKYVADHVETHCPYTLLTCPLGCDTTFPRQQSAHHVSTECPLRATSCPFAKIGCTTTCAAVDVPHHVSQNTERHLLLALNRMMEYQTVMANLKATVQHLQDENQALQQQLRTQQTALVQVTATADGTQRTLQQWTKRVQHVEDAHRKDRKRVAELERRTAPSK